jgi:hypothetical protein
MFEFVAKFLELFALGNKRVVVKLGIVIGFTLIILPIALNYFMRILKLNKKSGY